MSRKTYNEFIVCNSNRLILYHGPSATVAMKIMRAEHMAGKSDTQINIKAANGTLVIVRDNKNEYMKQCIINEKAYRAKKQEAATRRNAEKRKKNIDKKIVPVV